jgi:hypothetical protein
VLLASQSLRSQHTVDEFNALIAGMDPRDPSVRFRSSPRDPKIAAGRTIVETARQLGHSASTRLTDYAGVFEEFDPAHRVTADEAIAAARAASVDRTECPALTTTTPADASPAPGSTAS